MKHEFICSQCGETKSHDSDITTGYGVDKDGNKVCYSCCGLNDAKELETLPMGGKTIHYLDTKNKVITNWPGSLKIPISHIREGRHNIAGKRFDTWFKYAGNQFHAVQYGTNTQIAHIKRVKPF